MLSGVMYTPLGISVKKPLQERKDMMQKNLWGGDECIDLQCVPRRTPEPTSYTPVHCEIYGHTWEYFGITGLKKCTVCQIKGYCPVCTPIPPLATARPFYCTMHTPTTESMVSA